MREVTTMKKLMIVGFALLLAAGVRSEGEAVSESNPWRVTVGGGMRHGIDGSFHMRSGRAAQLVQPVARSSRPTSSAASSAAGASGRKTFNNGFIDADAAGVSGETWNWRLDDAADASGSSIDFRTAYEDVSVTERSRRIHDGRDEEYTPGVNVELTREVWRDGRFGVDVGLGLSWYNKVKVLRAAGNVYAREVSRTSGELVYSVAKPDGFDSEPGIVNADGSLGAGSFDGPGPVIDFSSASLTRNVLASASSGSTRLWMRATGKLSMLEAQLTVQPTWQVTDDFSLRGKAGAAMIYTELEVDATVVDTASGAKVHASQDSSDFLFCGILGASAEYLLTEHVGLRAGVEMLVGAPDADVSGSLVKGKVSPGKWGWTLGLVATW